MVAMLQPLVGLPVGWLAQQILSALSGARDAPGPHTQRLVGRRGFVRNAALGAVGAVLTEVVVGFYVLFRPNKTGAFGGELAVAAAQVPGIEDAPLKIAPSRFWLVKNEDGLLALYWKCPHLGCTVPWASAEDRFHCPCHGSIYEKNGAYVGGPAPRGLDLMRVKVDRAGNVTGDTGDIRQRGQGYDPSMAVPYEA